MWLCPCPSSNHAGMVAPDARQLVRNAQEVSQQQGVSHHCSSSGATSIQNWKHWNPFLSEWPLIKSNSPATLSFPDMRPESCCIPDKSWKRSCSSITSDVLMHFPSGPPTLAPFIHSHIRNKALLPVLRSWHKCLWCDPRTLQQQLAIAHTPQGKWGRRGEAPPNAWAQSSTCNRPP